MSRNASGVYTLPAGNPVVTNTKITSAWANTTMTDVGTEIQNSLDRSGRGGMLAAFKAFDGVLGNPGITWANELTMGLARINSSEMQHIIGGAAIAWVNVNGLGVGAAAPAGVKLYAKGATEVLRQESTVARGSGGNYHTFFDPTGLKGYLGFAGTVDDNLSVWNTLNAKILFGANNALVGQFDATGKFGIGVVPAVALHMKSAAGEARVEGTGSVAAGGTAAFSLWDSVGQAGYYGFGGIANSLDILNAKAGTVRIYTGSVEGWRMNSDQSIGIGTSSTEAGVRVWQHVASATFNWLKVGNTLNAAYFGVRDTGEAQISSAGAYPVDIFTNGTRRINVASAGNVGINTTSPDALFGVNSAAGQGFRVHYDRGSFANIFAGINHLGDSGGVEFVSVNQSVDQGFTFSSGASYAGRTTKMRITSAGVIQDGAGIELGYKGMPVAGVNTFGKGMVNDATAGVTIGNGGTAGDTYAVYNNSAVAIAVNQGVGLTMRLAGTTTTGNRTLAPRGFCTVWYRAASEAIISGSGLT